MTDEIGFSPYTGQVLATYDVSNAAEVHAAVQAATDAAPHIADTPPTTLAGWLEAIADALGEYRDELAELADAETGLGLPRLTGEIDKTAYHLRFYASVAREGSHLGATIDSQPVELARVNRAVGPIAVFGASNFPFAFGVLGHDTAAAIAAGNPVVVKGHPAHPGLSRRLVEIAQRALRGANAPAGLLGLVTGFDAGPALVSHPAIRAVAFTGSERGGMALWRIANDRAEVIPVFAEMGTVNAVVVTAAADPATVAAGFVESFNLGTGQFCTKPGVLLVPAGSTVTDEVIKAVEAQPPGRQLTEAIWTACRRGIGDMTDSGATVLCQGLAADGIGWSSRTTVLSAPASTLKAGSALLTEVFGPVALVVEYSDATELRMVVDQLPQALAAAVHSGPGEDVSELATILSRKVGRVVCNGWTTNVTASWANQHGGPWPATSIPTATSVGAAGLQRFLRPVAFQSFPDSALPVPLQRKNPWSLPRRIDGKWEQAPS